MARMESGRVNGDRAESESWSWAQAVQCRLMVLERGRLCRIRPAGVVLKASPSFCSRGVTSPAKSGSVLTNVCP